ncbi:MAG: ABC transporter substrate-binding protein [Alphaproteobacteria bacterium]|nr:ABC transporter substrate-binding protein [Alphaproteobacteria bacterium]
MTPPRHRRWRALQVLAALTLAMPAIAGSGLRYAEDQAPAIVNPLFSTTMAEARVNELLFDSLWADDQELAAAPSLAVAGTPSEDMLQFTVTLREDVRWSDGTAFTASDVAFTVQALKDPTTLSPEVGRVDFIESAEVVSPREVRFTFTQPEPRPEEKLYFKVLPAHAFDNNPAVPRSHRFRTNPVGTGPYSLVRYNDDNSVTLASNAQHYEGVGIPELVMREVPDKSYQAKLLLYESLEALVRVLPRDLAILKNDRKVELYPYQTNSWWYVGFNLQRAPFDDLRVRQALGMMTDIDALLAPIGTGEVVSGPFVRSSPFYNHDVKPWPRNNNKAAELLTEAGFEKVDGKWTKDGQPLELKLTAAKSLESSQEVVINLQSQWRAQGVEVDVEFLDDADWKGRIWRSRDYELVLSQWSFDRNEDVRDQLHTSGVRNFGSYSNEAVDTLLDQARAARDPHEKKAALRQVHALVHEDAPMIFLWTLDSYSALTTRVSNVVIHPFYFFTFVPQWRMKSGG